MEWQFENAFSMQNPDEETPKPTEPDDPTDPSLPDKPPNPPDHVEL